MAERERGLVVATIEALVALYGSDFERYIRSHVTNLLQSGALTLQQAYRSKRITILSHERKLYAARGEAERNSSQYNLGLVRYDEKEIARLRTEHGILKEAMRLLGIPVP